MYVYGIYCDIIKFNFVERYLKYLQMELFFSAAGDTIGRAWLPVDSTEPKINTSWHVFWTKINILGH